MSVKPLISGIDTIFICFAEDETKNDGTPGREYYMSKNLMVRE